MRKIIPNLLAVLAVLNLVWLFVFNYRMPSFITDFTARLEQSAEQEDVSFPEEEALTAETEEEGTEEEEEAHQEASQQEAEEGQAPAGQEAAEAAGENTQEAGENPAGEGDGTAQAGETIALEGERTCRPADGNTPNIRSGPGSDYGVLRMAAYDEVMIVRGEEEGGWLPIRTQDGLEGYIFAGMLIIDEEAQ